MLVCVIPLVLVCIIFRCSYVSFFRYSSVSPSDARMCHSFDTRLYLLLMLICVTSFDTRLYLPLMLVCVVSLVLVCIFLRCSSVSFLWYSSVSSFDARLCRSFGTRL